MKRLFLFYALLACAPHSAVAQTPSPLPQFLHTLVPRCIGPANMSGRITDVAVYEKEPRIMYVASASAGLWKTTNNGTTWKPVFEHETTAALGAVAIAPNNPDLVWIGSGEANARNSVSWGDGVYKSTDGGKSWHNMGLPQTHHIGRIIIHPKNPEIVYVAALGHLWGANRQRGIFKTEDGGKTWHHVLAINADTGCVDLAMDPGNEDLLYAAAYQVRRDAYSGGNPMVQTGSEAGLYRTTDGGKSWMRMTNGLPNRALGRCGLCIARKTPGVVFAVVQTDETRTTVQGQSANQKLDIRAGGIFRSDDKGQTWKHLNSLVPRPFYYGQIRVDPSNDQRLYVLGIRLHVSTNGGKSFLEENGARGTHADYHALWINPRDPQHLVLGSDGGLNFSYDQGRTWERLKNLPISQFYAIGVDMRKPYQVYGGLQDNGTWCGPSSTRHASGISTAHWFNILGYDGYYCQVHPRDNDTVYAEGQYGMLRRINVRTGAIRNIQPRLDSKDETTNLQPALPRGTPGFRFNWCSPILTSPYADDELFYGGNFLFASQDRGTTWQVSSPDLTFGKPGPNAYQGHSITTIAASPLEDHLLYVGTDDGVVCVCRNWRSKVWTDLTETLPDVPKERWVSRLECSHYEPGTVYLTLNRHRHDDRRPYVFRSTDYGLHWIPLANNLPENGPVHVIREDPVNKDLLYVGTEFGLFVSLDAGKSWHKQHHLPTVPVHDLVIHARERELVIGTHGRAIWIMDVLPLQELTAKVLQQDLHLCSVRRATAFRQRVTEPLGTKNFLGENPPYGARFYYYFHTKQTQETVVRIQNEAGKTIASIETDPSAGLHHMTWGLNLPDTTQGLFNPVPAGTYRAILQAGTRSVQQPFPVEVDD